jgi:hypothetical protein
MNTDFWGNKNQPRVRENSANIETAQAVWSEATQNKEASRFRLASNFRSRLQQVISLER